MTKENITSIRENEKLEVISVIAEELESCVYDKYFFNGVFDDTTVIGDINMSNTITIDNGLNPPGKVNVSYKITLKKQPFIDYLIRTHGNSNDSSTKAFLKLVYKFFTEAIESGDISSLFKNELFDISIKSEHVKEGF